MNTFFHVVLAIVTIGLLPLVLSTSKFRTGYFILAAIVLFVVAAIIVWRRVRGNSKLLNQPEGG